VFAGDDMMTFNIWINLGIWSALLVVSSIGISYYKYHNKVDLSPDRMKTTHNTTKDDITTSTKTTSPVKELKIKKIIPAKNAMSLRSIKADSLSSSELVTQTLPSPKKEKVSDEATNKDEDVVTITTSDNTTAVSVVLSGFKYIRDRIYSPYKVYFNRGFFYLLLISLSLLLLYYCSIFLSPYGLNFTRLTYMTIIVMIIAKLASLYYHHHTNRQLCIEFIGKMVKKNLKYVQNGNEYPIEFLEEDVAELIDVMVQQQREEWKQSQQLKLYSPSKSLFQDDTQQTPEMNPYPSDGLTTPLINTTSRRISTTSSDQTATTTYVTPISSVYKDMIHNLSPQSSSPSIFLRHPNLNPNLIRDKIPTEVLFILNAAYVRKNWSAVTSFVSEDKRIQTFTCRYHGVPKKCWRRLDCIQRLSIGENQVRSGAPVVPTSASTGF
jgi:hypothetical protein